MMKASQDWVGSLYAEKLIQEKTKENCENYISSRMESLDSYENDATKDKTPLYISVLLGIGAWLSSLMFALFCALFFRSGDLALPASILLLGGAYAIYKLGRGVFLSQLLLAMCFLSSGLFTAGLYHVGVRGTENIAIGMILFQLLMIFLFHTNIHRFLSTITIVFSILFTFGKEQPNSVQGLIFLLGGSILWILSMLPGSIAPKLKENEKFERFEKIRKKLLQMKSLLEPVFYGLSTSFLLLLLFSVRKGFPLRHVKFHWWISSVGLFVLCFLLITRIFQALRINLTSPYFLGGTAFLGLTLVVTLRSPGILGAVFFLLLSIHYRNPILFRLGLAFLIVFTGFYYYGLEVSLLYKSFSLMVPGLVLLMGRLFLPKSEEMEQNA